MIPAQLFILFINHSIFQFYPAKISTQQVLDERWKLILRFTLWLLLLWFYLISNRQFSTFRLLYNFFIADAYRKWMITYAINSCKLMNTYTRGVCTKLPWEQCLIGLIFWNSKDIKRFFWNEESRQKVDIEQTFIYKVQNQSPLYKALFKTCENTQWKSEN